MRISFDDLTKEQAIDIYEWLLDKRAKLFFGQLEVTEKYLMEQIIREPEKSLVITNEIKALRSIPDFIGYLKDFISENVTGKEN